MPQAAPPAPAGQVLQHQSGKGCALKVDVDEDTGGARCFQLSHLGIWVLLAGADPRIADHAHGPPTLKRSPDSFDSQWFRATVSGKRTSLTDSPNGPAPEDAPETINSGLAGLVVGFLQVDEPTLRCDAF